MQVQEFDADNLGCVSQRQLTSVLEMFEGPVRDAARSALNGFPALHDPRMPCDAMIVVSSLQVLAVALTACIRADPVTGPSQCCMLLIQSFLWMLSPITADSFCA